MGPRILRWGRRWRVCWRRHGPGDGCTGVTRRTTPKDSGNDELARPLQVRLAATGRDGPRPRHGLGVLAGTALHPVRPATDAAGAGAGVQYRADRDGRAGPG